MMAASKAPETSLETAEGTAETPNTIAEAPETTSETPQAATDATLDAAAAAPTAATEASEVTVEKANILEMLEPVSEAAEAASQDSKDSSQSTKDSISVSCGSREEIRVSSRWSIPSSLHASKKFSIGPGAKEDDGAGGDTIPDSVSEKVPFSFMNKRLMYRVFDESGADATPNNIVDPDYVTMEHTFSHAAFESKPRGELGLKSTLLSETGGMKLFATIIDLDDIRIDHTIDTEEGYPPDAADRVDRPPSAFYLPKMFPPSKYPPEILVCLKETETIDLFELPSFSYDKTSPEGAEVEQENEDYQYITVGKGRNRKMGHQETQTRLLINKNRHTIAKRPKKKNQISFASVWDMLDTYSKKETEVLSEEEDDMVMYQSVPLYMLRKKRLKHKEKLKIETWEQISKLPSFFDAAILCFRVLAAKEYSDQQKMFRGLVTVDPLSPDLLYIYTMKSLWTFECAENHNRPISSISFNPKNPNILAVGHGKFLYADRMPGMVCIWSAKNPLTPERLYRFAHPVTALAFASTNPNWLAVAFATGEVYILDVTSHSVKIIAKSKRDSNPGFEPIWSAMWVIKEDQHEYIMTTGQDGRINRYVNTKTHELICTPMMRIAAVEGEMKGLEVPKPCLKADVPIVLHPAALCMRWHPTIDHIYLVGTDEGCVHKCSTNYIKQHMNVFKAHTGPIYSMIYSPHMNNLLATCGADNAIRLWIEDIDDVIVTLTCSYAVYDIAFCPVNATIIISVSGNVLSVWDLRRKTHSPCTEYTFPAHVVLTYVRFSPSGDNLFVGDTTGRVYAFHLEDTPIPPFFQKKMLDDAIKRALCTRPLLLHQLEKIQKFQDKLPKKKPSRLETERSVNAAA